MIKSIDRRFEGGGLLHRAEPLFRLEPVNVPTYRWRESVSLDSGFSPATLASKKPNRHAVAVLERRINRIQVKTATPWRFLPGGFQISLARRVVNSLHAIYAGHHLAEPVTIPLKLSR